MHSNLEKPKPIAPVFGISVKRGQELLAIMATNILHFAMCAECHQHIIDQPDATAILIAGDWYTSEAERQYTMLLWGKTVSNTTWWLYLTHEHKHIEYSDTLIAVREHLAEMYADRISPLN